MALSTQSDFLDFIRPLHHRLTLYDAASPPHHQPRNDAVDPTRAIPQGFIDAMVVREKVFVHEQHVPLANELDDDDARSFHWVAYASVPASKKKTSHEADATAIATTTESAERRASNSTKLPIGTIRLVPPPHGIHPHGKWHTAKHPKGESYVKLGRLAVVPQFRKAGISRLLIETAIAFARNNVLDITPLDGAVEALKHGESAAHAFSRKGGKGVNGNGNGNESGEVEVDEGDYHGLILVHAQTGVQKVWRRYGFELDEEMGEWDEEGIMHVGMWKRIDVSEARRRTSKVWLPGSPQARPIA